jgi:hypothetical protein
MSDMYFAGKNEKKVKCHKIFLKFFGIIIIFLCFYGQGDPKITKKLFFNYFFLYLVAIIAIIALYAKKSY